MQRKVWLPSADMPSSVFNKQFAKLKFKSLENVVFVICREKCGCHLSAEIPAGAVFNEQFAKFKL